MEESKTELIRENKEAALARMHKLSQSFIEEYQDLQKWERASKENSPKSFKLPIDLGAMDSDEQKDNSEDRSKKDSISKDLKSEIKDERPRDRHLRDIVDISQDLKSEIKDERPRDRHLRDIVDISQDLKPEIKDERPRDRHLRDIVEIQQVLQRTEDRRLSDCCLKLAKMLINTSTFLEECKSGTRWENVVEVVAGFLYICRKLTMDGGKQVLEQANLLRDRGFTFNCVNELKGTSSERRSQLGFPEYLCEARKVPERMMKTIFSFFCKHFSVPRNFHSGLKRPRKKVSQV